ncbi:TPA: phage protein NinX family protein [Proteus mirabilis]
MNKYTELSDFEINKKVAERLFLKFTNNWSVILVDGESFDPCNNPSDAMPIVFESGISLISDWNEVGVWGATNQPWYSSENKNPLRAAMEVYLMIKDAENEKV